MATVLVFGHERHITRLIEVNLKRQSYDVWVAESLGDAMTWLDTYKPEMLVLGEAEPGVDTLEECARSRGLRILRTGDLIKRN